MTPAALKPSQRFVRAAAQERSVLERQRRELERRRDSLTSELEELEQTIARTDERLQLLDRVAELPAEREEEEAAADDPANATIAPPGRELRGPQIRQTAVRLLLQHPQQPEALHYKAWYDLLVHAGFSVAGKQPAAVFLTQLGRSPVVRRGTQSGVYELDLSSLDRLRRHREDLHRKLQQLTTSSDAAVDLAAARTRRSTLTREIGKVEQQLEEAQALLGDQQRRSAFAARR